MALLDSPTGELGTLGKIGLMLQSFADPSIIPNYQKQQQEKQLFQMQLANMQQQGALNNLAMRKGELQLEQMGRPDYQTINLGNKIYRDDPYDDKPPELLLQGDAGGMDLKALAEAYAIKKASGVQASPEEEMGARAYEMMNRSELDYDPNTGQSRPKYGSLFSDNYDQDTQPQQSDLSYLSANNMIPTFQSGDNQTNNVPQPDDITALSQMPPGLFPKSQQQYQSESISAAFKERVNTKERVQAQKEFENTLFEMANGYKELYDKGALPKNPKEGGEPINNILRYLSGTETFDPWGITPGGQTFARMLNTESQIARDKINIQTPKAFLKLRKAGGLTGKELDSMAERDYYLQILGKVNMPPEIIKEMLRTLSQQFGTGELSKEVDNLFTSKKDRLYKKYGIQAE